MTAAIMTPTAPIVAATTTPIVALSVFFTIVSIVWTRHTELTHWRGPSPLQRSDEVLERSSDPAVCLPGTKTDLEHPLLRQIHG